MKTTNSLWTGLAVCILFLGVLSGCSDKKNADIQVKNPDVSLTCIGVLPVRVVVNTKKNTNFNKASGLNDGALVLAGQLEKMFMANDKIRFISPGQLNSLESDGAGDLLSRAKKAGSFVSCNGVLEVTLLRYRQRVGGKYTAETPASVSFTYQLLEVNSGQVLCRGRFDETQESVMENLFNFSSARKRGFTWVTAEELLREGLQSKLSECPYLR